MPRYCVEVIRTVRTASRVVEIEVKAENEDAAAKLALAKARDVYVSSEVSAEYEVSGVTEKPVG